MTKNLLKQVMVKGEPKPVKKESDFKLDGLVEKINSGYTIKNEPKHQIKKTFAPSTLAYNHGECPRYWYLAFSGVTFEDNSNAFVLPIEQMAHMVIKEFKMHLSILVLLRSFRKKIKKLAR